MSTDDPLHGPVSEETIRIMDAHFSGKPVAPADTIEVLKAARAPNKRGLWHREAREMKARGFTIFEIAEAYGKSGNAVKAATRGVKAIASHRPLYKATANGVSTGKLKRVAIAFSNEQLAAINIIAQERQLSFSKIVSDLVDLAIEEIIS